MKRLIVINLVLIVIYFIIPQKKLPKEIPKEISKEEIKANEIVTTNRSEPKPRKEIKTISEKGINLIKKYEGCKLVAYKLPNEKYYTIGYGHYSKENYQGQQITQVQAQNLLKNDLERFEGYVRNKCKHLNLNQNEFDALVSFTFNCGKGNLDKLIKNRSKKEIANKMINYTGSGSISNKQGLQKRRLEEQNLFLGGIKNEN